MKDSDKKKQKKRDPVEKKPVKKIIRKLKCYYLLPQRNKYMIFIKEEKSKKGYIQKRKKGAKTLEQKL